MGASRLYGVDPAELAVWARERQTVYESDELLDETLGLANGREMGRSILAAAYTHLRERGVAPDGADYATLAAALVAVSP